MSITDVDRMCRTCLTLNGAFLTIYSRDFPGVGSCIAEKLSQISCIKPSQQDGLPSRVCLSCASEINRSYLFKVKCESSESTLRQIVQQSGAHKQQQQQSSHNVSRYSTGGARDILPLKIVEPRTEQKPILIDGIIKQEYDTENGSMEVEEEVLTDNNVPMPPTESQEPEVQNQSEQEDTNMFTCKVCNANFDLEKKLKLHLRKRPDCEVGYTGTALARAPEDVVCDKCDQVFSDQASLLKHSKSHYPKPSSFTCDVCGATFSQATNLTRHRAEHPLELPFICSADYCWQRYATADQLQTHEKVHDKERPYQCTKCLTRFTHQSNFRRHLKKKRCMALLKTKEKMAALKRKQTELVAQIIQDREAMANEKLKGPKLKCDFCHIEFSDLVAQKSHTCFWNREAQVQLERVSLFNCSHCDAKFLTEALLNSHIVSIHPPKESSPVEPPAGRNAQSSDVEPPAGRSAENDTDEELLTIKTDLDATTEAPSTSFQANATDNVETLSTFSSTSAISSVSKFECPHCGLYFDSAESINHHIQIRECAMQIDFKPTQESLASLQLPDVEWTTVSKEVMECEKPSTGNDAMHSCPTCGKLFPNATHLQVHAKRHHKNPRPHGHSCTQCPRKFLSKFALENHSATHSGEKKFVCTQCGERFFNVIELKRHLKRKKHKTNGISTKPPIFKCSVCGKISKTRQQIELHEARHSDVKPFTCAECPRAFYSKYELDQHTAVHTGAKRFKCSVCGKSFLYRASLSCHEKKHNGS